MQEDAFNVTDAGLVLGCCVGLPPLGAVLAIRRLLRQSDYAAEKRVAWIGLALATFMTVSAFIVGVR
jgi:hypothetical protein